jgi:hypothetical protein
MFEGAVEVEPDGQLVLPKDDSTAEDEDTMAVDGGWYSVEDVTEDEEGADSGEDDLPIAEAGMSGKCVDSWYQRILRIY